MKRKAIILAVLMTVAAAAANAQKTPRYQGDVELGPSLGVGHMFPFVWANLHTSHGVRINDYLFTGVGTGVDALIGFGMDLLVPVFADIKGYYPLSDRFDLFAGSDIGYTFSLFHPYSGFYAVPQAGFAYKFTGGRARALTVTLGFTTQSIISDPVYYRGRLRHYSNALSLRVGYQF